MRSLFRPLLPLTAVALLLASGAHAQDKPALNTAPPGSRPAPVPPPAPMPAPQPARPDTARSVRPAPTPAPAYEPPVPAPANQPRPTQDNPSGLNFPGRPTSTNSLGGPELSAKKMFIYTNFGLGFTGNQFVNQFNVSAAPALGYRITDRFAAGPGISYAYSSYSLTNNVGGTFPNGERSITTSSLGLKAFAQFIVYKQFFVHGEYEVTNAEVLDNNLRKIKRTIATPLLGAGYRTEFSSNAAADIVVLYNFNDGIYSGLYGQPVIRFNFLFNIGRPSASR